MDCFKSPTMNSFAGWSFFAVLIFSISMLWTPFVSWNSSTKMYLYRLAISGCWFTMSFALISRSSNERMPNLFLCSSQIAQMMLANLSSISRSGLSWVVSFIHLARATSCDKLSRWILSPSWPKRWSNKASNSSLNVPLPGIFESTSSFKSTKKRAHSGGEPG